jgi:hypothetical protein
MPTSFRFPGNLQNNHEYTTKKAFLGKGVCINVPATVGEAWVTTSCEGDWRKGASGMDAARAPLSTDANWRCTPGANRRAVDVVHA